MHKHKVFNLIILDESGSMEGLKAATLTGFNELVQTVQGAQTQFTEQEHTITLVTFNGLGIKTLLANQPVDKLAPLDATRYKPAATTPLNDALGQSLLRLQWLTERERDYTVLVSILTDGEENASREFSTQQVRAMITRLKQHNWSFTYMGANHDVDRVAASLSIQSAVRFEADEQGMKSVFDAERKGRMAYYEKRSRGLSSQEAEEGYYQQP
ncbi:vWA domain-containing protein [Fibrivirga algicola]|uniref:VWA domain-containing protein n=1 Tax=Fibrivirga algicola TaxID=2950420 RepID=A0ABX0QU32_9BACT|nr:vWA domain-containing protein [Fibrivirga algicola]NID13709.1 VWA domain-containing protein [Fibrivirga algicola]